MESKKVYSFSNNGKPYKIILGGSSSEIGIELYDGNLHVNDDNVLSVKLQVEEIETGIIFKRTKQNYFIALEYKLTYFGEAYTKMIPILSNEVSTAKDACEQATQMLEKVRKKKEDYAKEQAEKLAKAKKEDTIDAIDIDGKPIKIWRRETYYGDFVLTAEGGQSYHTHADCFESWKPMYRRTFTKWQIVKKVDAKKQGLCECKLCQKYYDTEDEPNEYNQYDDSNF